MRAVHISNLSDVHFSLESGKHRITYEQEKTRREDHDFERIDRQGNKDKESTRDKLAITQKRKGAMLSMLSRTVQKVR